jgi:hypothetical protein
MKTSTTKRPNILLEIAVTIVAPAVVLMRLSGDDQLGATGALLLALAFPLAWGLRSLVLEKRLNPLAILGVVSTLLTGGIGLLKLDANWLAIKEAAVPGLIGMAVLVSLKTPWPLVRTLLYTPTVLAVDRIDAALAERGPAARLAFETCLARATILLAGTFFFSSAMNYLLARWIVTSPAGSGAFNAELGRLTLLSYPVIAIPSMLMMMGIIFYLARTVKRLTGLPWNDLFAGQ